jgi:hypothetical protein
MPETFRTIDVKLAKLPVQIKYRSGEEGKELESKANQYNGQLTKNHLQQS